MAPCRILALVVLLGTFAVPGTAWAKERTPSPVGAASAVAQRYWGAVPCRGQIKVLVQRPTAAGVDPDSDAWVTFDSPLGANNLAAPASSYTNCVIAFGQRRWPTAASIREDWDMFCATMIHEMGHLLGRSHDLEPGSVMAPVFTDVSGVPPICRANRPGRATRAARRGR